MRTLADVTPLTALEDALCDHESALDARDEHCPRCIQGTPDYCKRHCPHNLAVLTTHHKVTRLEARHSA